MNRLTVDEVAFCREYALTNNVISAFRVISSEDWPEIYCFVKGMDILDKPEIRQEIRRIRDQMANKEISSDSIMRLLK